MEILKNVAFYKEMLLGQANREYEFEGEYGPLIAIHGVLGGWDESSLKTYMEASNVEGVLLYCGSLLNGVDTYLPQLEEKISKYKKPLIVGLSAGGVVAIRCIAKNNYWDKIDKIITIGSPLNGIPRTIGGLTKFSKTAKDLEPGSILLEEISRLRPPKDKILSIFTKKDFYTPFPQNLKFSWPTVVLEANGHSDLILNHTKWVSQILDAELGINLGR